VQNAAIALRCVTSKNARSNPERMGNLFLAQVVMGILGGVVVLALIRVWRALARERDLLRAQSAAGIARPKLFSRGGKIAIAVALLPLIALIAIAAFAR
jgi:uncharacterized membrane protein